MKKFLILCLTAAVAALGFPLSASAETAVVKTEILADCETALSLYDGILPAADYTALETACADAKSNYTDAKGKNLKTLLASAARAAGNAAKLNFQIVSDPHMYADGVSNGYFTKYGDTYNRFKSALSALGTYRMNSSAVVVPGDLTCWGLPAEYELYSQAIASSQIPVFSTMGNHDFEGWNAILGDTPETSMKRFLDCVNPYYKSIGQEETSTVYYRRSFKDYEFIFLSPEAEVSDASPFGAYISQAQLDWFEAQLADCNPTKPLFVFCHHPLKGTVSRSDEWNVGAADAKLKDILKKYPQSVFFSGHLHNGEIGADAVYESAFGTFVDVPAFEENELPNLPYDPSKVFIAYDVYAYADRVLILPVDCQTEPGVPVSYYRYGVKIDRTSSERQSAVYDTATQPEPSSAANVTTLTFASAQKLDGIRVTPTSGALANYVLEGSEDGTNYVKISEGTFSYASAANKILFQPKSYVSLKLTAAGNFSVKTTYSGDDYYAKLDDGNGGNGGSGGDGGDDKESGCNCGGAPAAAALGLLAAAAIKKFI